jgi:hypothetical protein
MMFIDLLDGCCYRDQNTLNTFPVSEQKITLNNRTKQSEQNGSKSEFAMTEQDEQMRI